MCIFNFVQERRREKNTRSPRCLFFFSFAITNSSTTRLHFHGCVKRSLSSQSNSTGTYKTVCPRQLRHRHQSLEYHRYRDPMILGRYGNWLRRIFLRRMFLIIVVVVYLLVIRYYYNPLHSLLPIGPAKTHTTLEKTCEVCVSTDSFLQAYQSKSKLGVHADPTRAEPSVERIQQLLQIVRNKEPQYLSLLNYFDVFDMTDPMETIRNNDKRNSNIDEMKLLYNRYIQLSDDKRTVLVNESFIDYLRTVSNYLSDGLRDERTKKV